MLCTRSTPLRRNAASKTSSLPARDPVWEAAALAAAAVRPALITIIGLLRATSRAAEGKGGAALADEADIAGARDGGGEGGIEAGEGAHDSQAVGADDADVAAPRFGQH